MIITDVIGDIPTRSNGSNLNIDAAWFNAFKTTALNMPHPKKIILTHEDFTAAATTEEISDAINLRLAAREQLEWVQLKHSEAFAGPSITAFTLEVGITGNTSLYTPDPFDVFQAVADSARIRENHWRQPESYSADTSVIIKGTATGANVSALTAGSCEIIYWSTLLPSD